MRQKLRLRVLVPIAIVALLGLGYSAMAFTGTPPEESGPLKPAAGTTTKNPPAAPRLSRADWRKQANAVCAELTSDVAALGQPKKPEEVAQLLPETLAVADKALASLRALQPAKADAARVGRMNTFFATFIRLEKRAADALAAQDVERYASLSTRAFAANDAGSALARRLGAPKCAAGDTKDSKLQRALDYHRVVVAVLYTPDSNVDALTVREARLGAAAVHAGFVAIDATDTRSAALLARSYGVRAAPAVLIFVAGAGAVATFTDYVDSATIAQAAENAAL